MRQPFFATIGHHGYYKSSDGIHWTRLATQLITATVTPSSLTFASQVVGSSSAAQTVTLTNKSAVALSSLALSASSQFQLAGNTCPASLAPGASCTTGVVFAPTQTGPQAGSLSVTNSAMASAV